VEPGTGQIRARQPSAHATDFRHALPIWPRTGRLCADAIPGSDGVRTPTVLLPPVEPGLRSPAHLEGTTERQPTMGWTPIATMAGHPAWPVPVAGRGKISNGISSLKGVKYTVATRTSPTRPRAISWA